MIKKLFFSSLILSFGIINGQDDLIIQDFSMPICANGEGDDDTLHWYARYNGEVNGCDYKVVLVTLFTSW